MNKKKLLIVDGMSILYRAYHGGGHPLTLPNGQIITALYVFTKMLLRFMEYVAPTHIVVAFDVKGKTFRHILYENYKGSRKPMPEELAQQLPLVHQFLAKARIPTIGLTGYEADDVIGTIAKLAAKSENSEIYILSGDRDDFQLIDTNIKVIYPQKAGKFKVYSKAVFQEEYQFPVESFIFYKAILGDKSDDIPGVRGIGEVGATKIVQNFQDLDELYYYVEENSKDQADILLEKRKVNDNLLARGLTPLIYRKLVNEKENAYLSLRLSQIDTNVPLNFNWSENSLPDFKKTELYTYLDQFYFTSLVKQFSSFEENMQSQLVNSRKETTAALPFELAKSSEKLSVEEKANIFSLPKSLSIFSVHEFSNNLAQLKKQENIYLLQLDWQNEFGDFLKKKEVKKSKKLSKIFEDWQNNWLLFYQDSESETLFIHFVKGYDLEKLLPFKGKIIVQEFKNFLKQPQILANYEQVDFADLASQIHSLELYNYSLGRMTKSTLLAELLSLLPETNSLPKDSDYRNKIASLYTRSKVVFQENLSEFQELLDDFLCEKIADFCLIPLLYQTQLAKMNLNQDFSKFIKEVDLPLCVVAATMEKRGVQLDIEYLNKLKDEYTEELTNLEKEIMSYAEQDFNLQSPQQLSAFLFEELSLPKSKKTSLGYSTAQEVLENLIDKHPVIDLIIRYRFLQKLQSGFVESLLNLAEVDGSIHTTYQLNTTSTGRLSSTNPNLQNIPVRVDLGKKLRNAFIARAGYTFISADYSQIELRILAHMADDQKMQENYQQGKDIHRLTAQFMFQKPENEIDYSMRQAAKTINFSVIYGISEFSLAKDLNISYEMAKDYIKSYYQQYEGISHYMNTVIQEAENDGYIKTLNGRIRYISEFESEKHTVRQFAKRVAMNAPIQGTAADLIRKAMVNFAQELKKHSCDAYLIAQIHDELIVEVKEEEADKVCDILKRTMVEAMQLKVPLVVDTHIAKSWGGVK